MLWDGQHCTTIPVQMGDDDCVNTTRFSWLPSASSSPHPPTHSRSIFLSPQRTDQGRNKYILRITERAEKKQSDRGQKVCRAQEDPWFAVHQRTHAASPVLISSRQSYRASPTHQPSCSPAESEAQNGLTLKRELFIYPAARCF